jgi:hypothetical protein
LGIDPAGADLGRRPGDRGARLQRLARANDVGRERTELDLDQLVRGALLGLQGFVADQAREDG